VPKVNLPKDAHMKDELVAPMKQEVAVKQDLKSDKKRDVKSKAKEEVKVVKQTRGQDKKNTVPMSPKK
jgi:hypothetical protein